MTHPNTTAVVFSAPMAWGKTTRAEALKKRFGMRHIVDDFRNGDPIRPHTLHLTNQPPSELANTHCKIVAEGWKK